MYTCRQQRRLWLAISWSYSPCFADPTQLSCSGSCMSPAIILCGRLIKDHLPILRDKYRIRKHWREIGELREDARGQRHMRNKHFYDVCCRLILELQIDESVQIQNQDDHHPRQWMKTGRIVETVIDRLYHVRVDWSNRVSLCNRRFLHMIYPVMNDPHHSIHEEGLLNPKIATQNRFFTSTPEPYDNSSGARVLLQNLV